jgi:hypothetical protein
VPTHPIYIPIAPAHPIVLPPEGSGGTPAHPIYYPVAPAHPIVLPPAPGEPPTGGTTPEHPIVLPPTSTLYVSVSPGKAVPVSTKALTEWIKSQPQVTPHR